MKIGLCVFLLSICIPCSAQIGSSQLSPMDKEAVNENMRLREVEDLKRQKQAALLVEQGKKAQEKAMRDYELARESAMAKIRDLPVDAPGKQAQLDEFACSYAAAARIPPSSQAIDTCITNTLQKREQERQSAAREAELRAVEQARQQAEEEQRVRREQLVEQARKKQAEELAAKHAAEAAARKAEEKARLLTYVAIGFGLFCVIGAVYRYRKLILGKVTDAFSSGISAESVGGKSPVSDFSRNAGVAGALLLFGGAFSPIVRLPIVGSVNYFRDGEWDGIVVLVIAVLSLYFALTQRIKNLFWAACGSTALVLFTLGHLAWRMHEVKSSMESGLKGNPFRGLFDVAMNSVQFEWGWCVLFLGIILMFVSARSHKKQLGSSEI